MARNIPWKTLAIAGGAALGGFGLLALASRPRRVAPTRPQRIALIGDSYSVGLYPKLKRLLPDFRSEEVSLRGSTNTKQWADHPEWSNWIASYKPDLVLVALGVNDYWKPSCTREGDCRPGQKNPADYRAIVRHLRSMGVERVVWIEPPAGVTVPVDEERRIIRSLGVPVVPATMTQLYPESDGKYVHPVDYAPWAQEIANAIKVT